MNRLKIITNWIPLIPQFKNLHNYHVIIQPLNTFSLLQHYEDINHDHNLQMFHILCFIKTKIHHASTYVHKFINSSKYSYISIHDGHGSMMMYDIHMHLKLCAPNSLRDSNVSLKLKIAEKQGLGATPWLVALRGVKGHAGASRCD